MKLLTTHSISAFSVLALVAACSSDSGTARSGAVTGKNTATGGVGEVVQSTKKAGASSANAGAGTAGALQVYYPPSLTGGNSAKGGAGASVPLHPLFGTGDYAGVDTSDPCNSAPTWKASTGLDTNIGSQVVYNGVVYERTAGGAQNWFLPDCPPDGVGAAAWCEKDWGWKAVKTC